MKRLLTVCGVIALTMGAGALGRAAAASGFRFWDASALQFKDTPKKGIQRAVLWGDPGKGKYGLMVRYSAGTEHGWHTHSNPFHLVVISGTLVIEPEGSAPQELGPGSGASEVANAKHNTKCEKGADCVFFLTGLERFDVKPAMKPVTAK